MGGWMPDPGVWIDPAHVIGAALTQEGTISGLLDVVLIGGARFTAEYNSRAEAATALENLVALVKEARVAK